MSATTTLDRLIQTSNSVVQAIRWEGSDPVQDSLAEWLGEPLTAPNSEPHDDAQAVTVLSALHYPAWKRVWDNPEDSVYDQFLFDL